MPSFTVIYYAGLIPAALLMMARAMWLANRHAEHVTRPVAVALCLIVALTWPISLPIGLIIKLSEWTHLDGWIDAYLGWLERLARRIR
jgi:hypothetical protein